ncbi:MAG: hypothetical protein ACKVQS_09540 [Fimbriimonadaceae bacterium]
MKRVVWLVLPLLVLVACGPKNNSGKLTPEEAAERAGLRRDQLGQAKGEQTIKGADGTTTVLLKVDDLGQYGLALYPGATAKDGDAFQKTDSQNVTVFYSLLTSDPAKNVVKFYEDKLGKKGNKSGDTGTLISGELEGGKTTVVTVVDEGDKGSRVEAQIYAKVK